MGLLYSNMKIFHYKEKLDSLPFEINTILAPLHIRLKPTNICNHNCWYCAYRRDNIQLGKDMILMDHIPQRKILELIEDFTQMGVKAVTFSGGGEPLCYPYLLQALHLLSERHIKFSCLTNGTNLDKEIAEYFAFNGTWIRISLDGWDDKSYASYRGVSVKEYAKLIRNIENFKKLGGVCYLGVIIIIDKNNAYHVYQMIKKLQNIGVDSVKVSPCIVSNDGAENNAYHQQYFDIVNEQIERFKKEFKLRNFEIFNSYHKQLETFDKDYTWCPYIQINPVIGADLNVYSCHDKAYNIKEGLVCSVKEKHFKDVWFSDKLKFFKINPKLHCKHHCMVNDKNNLILDYLNADVEHLNFV